jgi:hypothetical protein
MSSKGTSRGARRVARIACGKIAESKAEAYDECGEHRALWAKDEITPMTTGRSEPGRDCGGQARTTSKAVGLEPSDAVVRATRGVLQQRAAASVRRECTGSGKALAQRRAGRHRGYRALGRRCAVEGIKTPRTLLALRAVMLRSRVREIGACRGLTFHGEHVLPARTVRGSVHAGGGA